MIIRGIATCSEAEICARLMSTSKPWTTLGRDYDTSLAIMLDESREVYVAVDEGHADEERVHGFMIIEMTGAFVGYIKSIGVAREARGRGVGTRLIKFAEQRIFRDTPNVFLCVSSFNPGARRLYERLGYKVIGELKDYIVAEHSEFLLRKTIGPLAEFRKHN